MGDDANKPYSDVGAVAEGDDAKLGAITAVAEPLDDEDAGASSTRDRCRPVSDAEDDDVTRCLALLDESPESERFVDAAAAVLEVSGAAGPLEELLASSTQRWAMPRLIQRSQGRSDHEREVSTLQYTALNRLFESYRR